MAGKVIIHQYPESDSMVCMYPSIGKGEHKSSNFNFHKILISISNIQLNKNKLHRAICIGWKSDSALETGGLVRWLSYAHSLSH